MHAGRDFRLFSFATQATATVKVAMVKQGAAPFAEAYFFGDEALCKNLCLLLALVTPEDDQWVAPFLPSGMSLVEYVVADTPDALGQFGVVATTFALGRKLLAKAELLQLQVSEDKLAEATRSSLEAAVLDIESQILESKTFCEQLLKSPAQSHAGSGRPDSHELIKKLSKKLSEIKTLQGRMPTSGGSRHAALIARAKSILDNADIEILGSIRALAFEALKQVSASVMLERVFALRLALGI